MPKYRASKGFVIAMGALCPVTAALYFGLVPELEAMKHPKVPGDLEFPVTRPCDAPQRSQKNSAKSASSVLSMEWLEQGYDDLMAWDKNPWKTKRVGFGDHYFELLSSKDPKDQARAAKIREKAEALLKQLLARYPELAVPSKNVPPERNGFLKWLEFCDRFDPDHKGTPSPNTAFPKELTDHLLEKAPWNAEAARNWLAKENAFLNEIRAIGLMPEQSVEGIDVHRYSFISARFAKGCAEALLMDARLAAEDGDVSRAMASVQAANGIAAHLGNVETPTLLAITVQILIQRQVQSYSLSEILPALPAGRLDPVAWENVVNPVVSQPAEFARIMKGEWNVTSREYLLPMLCDTEDPKYPSDPVALLDFHAGGFVDVVKTHEAATLPDLPKLEFGEIGDNSHLSRSSRQLTEMLFVGARAWRKGWDRTQSAAALSQAAFTIMKGESPPNDPIYGQPYRWDPASRTLSAPDSPEFKELDLKPIKIPKP